MSLKITVKKVTAKKNDPSITSVLTCR
jgi:hypothetical protein